MYTLLTDCIGGEPVAQIKPPKRVRIARWTEQTSDYPEHLEGSNE